MGVRGWSIAVVAMTLAVCGTARAEPPIGGAAGPPDDKAEDGAPSEAAAWLDVDRGPGAERCPSAAALREDVVRRIGRDPFEPDARLRLRCGFVRTPEGWTARIESRERDSPFPPRVRPFGPVRGSCAELGALVAFSLSVTLPDEIERTEARAPIAAPPPRAFAPTADIEAARPLPAPVVAAEAAEAWVEAGPLVAAGVLPRTSFGLALGAGVGWTRARLGAELRLERALDDAQRSGGLIEADRVTAAGVPCWAYGAFAGCAVMRVGVVSARLDGASRRQAPVWEAGVRLEGRRSVGAGHALGVSMEATAPLARVRLAVDDAVVWRAPWIAGSVLAAWSWGGAR